MLSGVLHPAPRFHPLLQQAAHGGHHRLDHHRPAGLQRQRQGAGGELPPSAVPPVCCATWSSDLAHSCQLCCAPAAAARHLCRKGRTRSSPPPALPRMSPSPLTGTVPSTSHLLQPAARAGHDRVHRLHPAAGGHRDVRLRGEWFFYRLKEVIAIYIVQLSWLAVTCSGNRDVRHAVSARLMSSCNRNATYLGSCMSRPS